MHRFATFLLLSAGWAFSADPPLSVHLRTSLPSPQPVGTPVGLFPEAENVGQGMHVVRYSVSVNGGPFHVIRDFSQQTLFAWAPELMEQTATLRVDVRNNETKGTARDELPFRIVSRVKGASALVMPTSHPLVALFSAPPCPEGTQFRVAFAPVGEEAVSRTPAQPCRGSISSNVYVAGMRAETEYRLRSELTTNGKVKTGDWLPYRTGILDGHFTPVSVAVPRVKGSSVSEPVLIYSAESLNGGGIRPLATDLSGRVIWYLRSAEGITRVLPGGRFLTQGDGMNSVNSTREEQLLREVDLAGNIVRETNAGAVGEQLASRGIHSDCRSGGKECLSGFHHEAIRLPNGHTLVIAGLERMMPAGTQGSEKPVDVVGDVVVDLDEEFQVAGLWNEFDHLDINRKSVFNARCKTGQGGCPPVLLAPEANGWTHSNSLQYIPSSGDFLISVPEQDWVVKVDWKNGKGSGKVLWRLGKGGDFKLESGGEDAWFSYAHDVGYEPAGSNTITIADDANIQFKNDKKTGTRAQIWKLDEEKRVATLAYNVDLGLHTRCCGSMQTLKNGNYTTVAGWVPTMFGRTVETDHNGKILFAIDLQGALVYRSFRVEDMYSAPMK
jgi:arylsulfate sulfotransferase